MKKKTAFRDDWFYFEKEVAKAEGRRKRLRDLVWIGLPGKSVQLKLGWFSEDDAGHYLACLLAATLYYVKDEWEFFLRIHLKKHSQNVLVFCEGLKRAMPGPQSDWNFSEIPVAFRSTWPDSAANRQRSERVFLVNLILDEGQDLDSPDYLAQCALAWLNKALLEDVGNVRNADAVIDRFWKVVQRDLKKMYGLFR